MPITSNRMYNDPALGAAFSSLAAAFSPPSGADINGFAQAKLGNQKYDQLSQLFTTARSPDFDQAEFDRMGQATGQWTPSTGYYGVDSTAATSRGNNAADNARAIQQTTLEAEAALARQNAAPVLVNEGQTAFLPGQTQSATGLPERFSGAMTLGQGETAYMPGGETLSGADKPLSETELKAAIMADLPLADQQAAVLSDIPIENIIMGDQPTMVRRSDAVGQKPYFNPNASTNVNVAPGETAYDREVGTGLGKQYLAIQEAATTARTSLDALTVMERAASDENFYSGAGGDQVLALKRAMTAMGGNPDGVTSMETFNSAASQAALASMGGSLGAGFSNADRDFIMGQVPNLGNTPAGNKALIGIHRQLAQRRLQIAEQAEVYAKDHGGRIDAGFNAFISQWAEQNPLFATDASTSQSAPGATGAPNPADATAPVYAQNPATGELLQLQNGQWVPAAQ